MIKASLPGMVQRSQKIVHGVVTAAEVVEAPSGSIWTRYTLGQVRAAKGTVKSSTIAAAS
jgi:hypothetical protein